jgi:hypothetical protein
VADDTTFGFIDVLYGVTLNGTLTTPLTLSGDFAVYVAAGIPPVVGGIAGASILPESNFGLQGPLVIKGSSMQSGVGDAVFSTPTASNLGVSQIYSARRVGKTVILAINGVEKGRHTFTDAPSMVCKIVATMGFHTPNSGLVAIYEVQAYDQTVSDAYDAAITQALINKFTF